MSSKQLNKVKGTSSVRFYGIWRWMIAAAAPQSDQTGRVSLSAAFVPGELLVKFRPEVRREAAEAYRQWFNISTVRTFAINGYCPPG
jgi:hypothetical protein